MKITKRAELLQSGMIRMERKFLRRTSNIKKTDLADFIEERSIIICFLETIITKKMIKKR